MTAFERKSGQGHDSFFAHLMHGKPHLGPECQVIGCNFVEHRAGVRGTGRIDELPGQLRRLIRVTDRITERNP